MAKTPKEYQRLPGRGVRTDGIRWVAASRSVCTLWMGHDHLLLVDRTGYSETYKRFYYRDIQAFMMRETMSGTVGSLVLGLLTLLFLLWAIAISNAPGRWTLGIIVGCLAFFTLLNLWFGPTCVTHIKTAVQTEHLPSWNRVRAARKGLAKVRPRLTEAQGEYSVDELKAQLQGRISPQGQSPQTS